MKARLRRLARALHRRLPPRWQCRVLHWFSPGAARVGAGSFVHPSVQLLGKAHVQIGRHSVIGADAWLNVNDRSGGQPRIRIGDHCFIGRRNFFSSGREIDIGSFVLTANDCFFLGSSHVVTDPMVPCLSTGTTNQDAIRVGHNTFIGAGARILGQVEIGHGCVIGADSMVTRDIPPFSVAVGRPAAVVRRYSVRRRAWVAADAFDRDDEAALPSADDYLALLQRQPAPHMPYIAAGADMGNC